MKTNFTLVSIVSVLSLLATGCGGSSKKQVNGQQEEEFFKDAEREYAVALGAAAELKGIDSTAVWSVQLSVKNVNGEVARIKEERVTFAKLAEKDFRAQNPTRRRSRF